MRLLLAHECLGASEADNAARGACAFEDFWQDGWTPKDLLRTEANVYATIATALKGGAWRRAGLAKLAATVSEGDGLTRKLRMAIARKKARRRAAGLHQLTRSLTVGGERAEACAAQFYASERAWTKLRAAGLSAQLAAAAAAPAGGEGGEGGGALVGLHEHHHRGDGGREGAADAV